MAEYGSFNVTDIVVEFSIADGPTGTEPHNGDPEGAIDRVLESYPCEDTEVHGLAEFFSAS